MPPVSSPVSSPASEEAAPSLVRIPFWPLLARFIKSRHDILNFFVSIHQDYGDLIRLPLGVPSFLLNHPADIKHVMVTNSQKYEKTGVLVFGHEVFGKGLLSSREPLHMRQRRLIQPMFHRQKLVPFADLMIQTTLRRSSEWKENEVIDLDEEMMHITLSVVSAALFSFDISEDAKDLGEAITFCLHYLTNFVSNPLSPSNYLPLSQRRQYLSAVRRMDESIYKIINSRKSQSDAPEDLLSMLLAARYEDGSALSEKQIRDEVLTFILAGHETTANALAWMFYRLSQSPESLQRAREEVDRLGGRLPTLSDLPSLGFLEMCFWETLRLYPPIWLQARSIIAKDRLPSGIEIPVGGQVLLIPYVSQRNPRYFPNPEKFDPDRFRPENQTWPSSVFFPFGAGPRSCIGEPFAKMEAVLVSAVLLQKFDFTLEDGQDFTPDPLLTLRLKNGLKMRPRLRPAIPA